MSGPSPILSRQPSTETCHARSHHALCMHRHTTLIWPMLAHALCMRCHTMRCMLAPTPCSACRQKPGVANMAFHSFSVRQPPPGHCAKISIANRPAVIARPAFYQDGSGVFLLANSTGLVCSSAMVLLITQQALVMMPNHQWQAPRSACTQHCPVTQQHTASPSPHEIAGRWLTWRNAVPAHVVAAVARLRHKRLQTRALSVTCWDGTAAPSNAAHGTSVRSGLRPLRSLVQRHLQTACRAKSCYPCAIDTETN